MIHWPQRRGQQIFSCKVQEYQRTGLVYFHGVIVAVDFASTSVCAVYGVP